MTPGIDDDVHKNHKPQCQQDDCDRLLVPYRIKVFGDLIPIHVTPNLHQFRWGQYPHDLEPRGLGSSLLPLNRAITAPRAEQKRGREME